MEAIAPSQYLIGIRAALQRGLTLTLILILTPF